VKHHFETEIDSQEILEECISHGIGDLVAIEAVENKYAFRHCTLSPKETAKMIWNRVKESIDKDFE